MSSWLARIVTYYKYDRIRIQYDRIRIYKTKKYVIFRYSKLIKSKTVKLDMGCTVTHLICCQLKALASFFGNQGKLE